MNCIICHKQTNGSKTCSKDCLFELRSSNSSNRRSKERNRNTIVFGKNTR